MSSIPGAADKVKPEPDPAAEGDEIDELSDDAIGWLDEQKVTNLKADAGALSSQVNQLATEAFKSPALQAAFSEPQTASSEDFTQDDAPKDLDKLKQAVVEVLAAQNVGDLGYNARTFVAAVFGVTPDPAKPADFSFEVFTRLANGQSLDDLLLDDEQEKATNVFNSFLENGGDSLLKRLSAVAAQRNDGPVDALMSAQYLPPLSPASAYAPVIWPRSSDKVWVAGVVAQQLEEGQSVAAILQDGPILASQRIGRELPPPVAASCIGLGICGWVKGIVPNK